MKFNKKYEAAYNEFMQYIKYFFRGKFTRNEMVKAICKAVAHHHYANEWAEMADFAMTARNAHHFEEMVTNYFTVTYEVAE